MVLISVVYNYGQCSLLVIYILTYAYHMNPIVTVLKLSFIYKCIVSVTVMISVFYNFVYALHLLFTLCVSQESYN